MTSPLTEKPLDEHPTVMCPFCQRGEPCPTSSTLALQRAAEQARRYFVVVEEPLIDLPDEEEPEPRMGHA